MRKTNMTKTLKQKKKIAKKIYQKNKKCLNKLAKFCQQIRQGPYFICIVCHWCLYKRSVRLFKHEKYILTAELYCLVRSFDEKTYIYETCHKHISRNEMPCQAVFDKMSLDPIPDELKNLKKSEKLQISQRIIFKKIAIMHGKEDLQKLRVVFVISLLKQQVYAIFCLDLQIK